MNKQLLYWTMTLLGTAIGAGILFLPITVGIGGVISLLAIFILAYPLTNYAHKLLSKYIYSSSKDNDSTKVVDSDFGTKVGFF